MPRQAFDPQMRVAGAWPFVTFRSYTHQGHRIVWRARHNRKGLVPDARSVDPAQVPVWQTQGYNWVTGAFFAVGSLLFILGAVLALVPHLPVGMPPWLINAVFFAGSLPFTIAGYLQHFQAANAPEFTVDPKDATAPRQLSLIGWHPENPGWISTFAQFIGTLAFNVNTADALIAPSSWYMQDLVVWLPVLVGSVLFMISGYMAFIETSHGYWAWRPGDLDWWIVSVNLLGCLFFMVAGCLAYVPRGPEAAWIGSAANGQIGLGALGFLIGALLLMRESRLAIARSGRT